MTLQGRNQAKILDKSKAMVEIGLKIYENLGKAAALSVLPLITPLHRKTLEDIFKILWPSQNIQMLRNYSCFHSSNFFCNTF